MPISRKPLSKAEKSLVAVCVLVVLPLSALVFLYGGRDAEPRWDIAADTPRPTPNGYDFYVAAAKATVRFTPEVDAASDGTSEDRTPGSPYALKNYSLARRQQWLGANAPAFALVNKGLATPSMAPVYMPMSMSSDWGKMRQLARDMSARAHTFQMANQPMRATMSALDTIQMAQDTTRGGGLLPRLVGIAISAIGRGPLDDWNKTVNALSGEEARSAAQRLEAILEREPSTAQTQTIAKRESLLELRRILDTPGWRKILVPSPKGSTLRQGLSQLWQTQSVSKQTIYENMSRALDAQVSNAALPYSQSQKSKSSPDLDIFTKYLTGMSSNRFGQNEARQTTANTMLLLRLALRSYIAQHGAAPPTLAALVPGILKKIPTDVYNDGKPLFYTPQGKTYKLWSIGSDGINNGGVPLARRNGDKGLAPVQDTLINTGDFVAGLCR